MDKAFIDLISITEVAAIATYQMIGRNNKEKADEKAVIAMEHMLNQLPISAEVVIGEGEIDEAPQLYLGQKLGLGGEKIDIAVDPIEGTKMVAKNQSNAIAVMALAQKNGFFSAPDMYMEKLIVGKELKGVIDLNNPITENIKIAAQKLNKSINEMTIAILDKPRHQQIIKEITEMGARIALIPDGDVVISIEVCTEEKYDMFYSIGGSPEGVINAAIVSSLGGDMQGRLINRIEAKGATSENIMHSEIEKAKCNELGIKIGTILKIDDLVLNDDVVIFATGITNGDLLKGVIKKSETVYECNSIFIRKKTSTIIKTHSRHDIRGKNKELQEILLENK